MSTSVQIPPDSTGKKIGTTERRHIGFDGSISLPNVGALVIGQTSGAQGYVTSVATEGYAIGSGVLHLKEASDTLFQDNEVLEVSSSAISSVAFNIEAQVDVHFQQVILSDPDNPDNRQKVDRFGATVNTFTSGSPAFTPFGAMVVGQTQIIKEYRFTYDIEATSFWDRSTGGGSLTHEPLRATVHASTGTTAGDSVARTSHFYHPYIPGIGNSVEMSIELGDIGKTNLERCWGIFDDDNGIFFRHDENGLNVVIRTNITGTPTEVAINQVDFSDDPVDGTDSLGLTLDVTKGNIYYIDFQWLGAGRVNFGIFSPEGERILMHVMTHANTVALPYIQTATLPIAIEQINNGAVVSGSEMRWLCGTVFHTSLTNPDTQKYATSILPKSTIAEVPVVSFRPALTVISGQTNRALASFESLRIVNTSSEPALVSIYAGNTLTGAVFARVSNSVLEEDTTATALAGGRKVNSMVIAPNATEKIMASDDTSAHALALFLNADGTTQRVFTITAQSLTGASTSIAAGVNWGELRF